MKAKEYASQLNNAVPKNSDESNFRLAIGVCTALLNEAVTLQKERNAHKPQSKAACYRESYQKWRSVYSRLTNPLYGENLFASIVKEVDKNLYVLLCMEKVFDPIDLQEYLFLVKRIEMKMQADEMSKSLEMWGYGKAEAQNLAASRVLLSQGMDVLANSLIYSARETIAKYKEEKSGNLIEENSDG